MDKKRNNLEGEARSTAVFFIKNAFFILFALLFIGFGLLEKRFFLIENIATILLQSAPYMIMASGVTFVFISGDFDLSVGSVSFFAVGVGGLAISAKLVNTTTGILIMMALGLILGLINGLIITKLRIPGFITTLGMLIGVRGLGLTFTGQRATLFLPKALRGFSRVKLGPLYAEFYIAIAIMVICHIILQQTPFGRKIHAMGDNEKAAERLGIKIPVMKIAVFTISGFLAAASGIIYITQAGSVHSQFAYGWEFITISMAVIGGVSLFGGKGKLIPGVLIGVLLIMMIDTGLVYMGASPYVYPLVRGVIIFIAIFADSFKQKRAL